MIRRPPPSSPTDSLFPYTALFRSIERALSGRLTFAANSEHDAPRPDFLLFYRDAANYPWVSQALWLYSQMVRWGHAAWDAQALEIVRQVFQPQIYRRVLIDAGTPLPGAMEKVEGSIDVPTGVGTFRGRLKLVPDRFFDSMRFDQNGSASGREKLCQYG